MLSGRWSYGSGIRHSDWIHTGAVVHIDGAPRVRANGVPDAVILNVPRKDVKMDRLVRTEHHSYCPYKGQASYFTLVGARTAENAVWSYETPYDEVIDVKERLAFYPDRVDEIVAE